MSVGLEGIYCIAWDRSFVSTQELGSERSCMPCRVLSFQTFTVSWKCTEIAHGFHQALLLCPLCMWYWCRNRVQLHMNEGEGPREKKINWSTVTYPNTLTYNLMPFTVWGVFISRLNECSDKEVRGLKVSEATRLHRCGRQVIFIWTLMVFISVLYEEVGNSPFFWYWYNL